MYRDTLRAELVAVTTALQEAREGAAVDLEGVRVELVAMEQRAVAAEQASSATEGDAASENVVRALAEEELGALRVEAAEARDPTAAAAAVSAVNEAEARRATAEREVEETRAELTSAREEADGEATATATAAVAAAAAAHQESLQKANLASFSFFSPNLFMYCFFLQPPGHAR